MWPSEEILTEIAVWSLTKITTCTYLLTITDLNIILLTIVYINYKFTSLNTIICAFYEYLKKSNFAYIFHKNNFNDNLSCSVFLKFQLL